jgi:acylphosphatase
VDIFSDMDAGAERVRAHLTIEGRVQGVFFRASAAAEAKRHGITGWARNCPDGSVEIVVEGDRPSVEKFIEWCRHGPPGARVDAVRVESQAARGDFAKFSIRR